MSKNSHATRAFILLSALVLSLSAPAQAEKPLAVFPTNGPPIILQSGDYEVTVKPTLAWTPAGIRFEGVPVGLSNGFYGTVLWIGPAQFIGTGHHEAGSEHVIDVTLLVDGVKKQLAPGSKYSGSKLELKKHSRIDKLDAKVTLRLDAKGLHEAVQLQAVAEQSLDGIYVFMHPFHTNFTEYAGAEGTNSYTGVLRSTGGWGLQKRVEWTALYNPVEKLGVVVAYPQAYDVAGIKNGIWDQKHYHKFYLQAMAKQNLAQGSTHAWEMHLQCFRAPPAIWQKTATALARQPYSR